jgi:hypothetical protein
VKDLELLEKKSFRLHVAGGKASAVGFLFVNLVVGSLTGAGSLVGATFPKTVEIWRDFTPEKLRAEARAKIDADFESKLDERSRKIAEARLSNRPAAFPPASPPALT